MRIEMHGQTLLRFEKQVSLQALTIFESNAHAQRISWETTIMKPTFSTITNSLRRDSFELSVNKRPCAPLTDHNYHSVAIEEAGAPYVRKCARSFWNITGDYFKNEAALWAVLTITAFLPLISNARAVMEFMRAIGN